MSGQLAYVELIFADKAKELLKTILNQITKPDQFYYSDVVSQISGDVTANAHLTLFFGLKQSELNNLELKNLISQINILELQMEKLFIIEGYQGLYKVLCIKIADPNNELENLSKKLRSFEHDESVTYQEFKPHVTLAYVKSDYQIPKNFVLPDIKLKVVQTKLSIRI